MNQDKLLDELEQISDTYIREAGESRKARPNRRPLWIAAAAAVIVLAAVTGLVWPKSPTVPDGPTAANPGVTEPTDPEPTDPQLTESGYDVFSDPNVLWGTEHISDENYPVILGCVKMGEGLKEVLETANTENFIAFRVKGLCRNFQIDLTCITYPDAAGEESEKLAEMIQKMYEQPEMMWEIFNSMQLYVNPFGQEEIVQGKYNPFDWFYSVFVPELRVQEAKVIRANMILYGFTPVYEMAEDVLTQEEMLTFVGTADQIFSFKEAMNGEDEGYCFLAPNELVFDE